MLSYLPSGYLDNIRLFVAGRSTGSLLFCGTERQEAPQHRNVKLTCKADESVLCYKKLCLRAMSQCQVS